MIEGRGGAQTAAPASGGGKKKRKKEKKKSRHRRSVEFRHWRSLGFACALAMLSSACDEGGAPARRFGSRQLLATRDPTLDIYEQPDDHTLVTSTTTGPAGSQSSYVSIDVSTGQVTELGATVPDFPSAATDGGVARFTCATDQIEGTSALIVTDTQSGQSTIIDGNSAEYPACPSTEGQVILDHGRADPASSGEHRSWHTRRAPRAAHDRPSALAVARAGPWRMRQKLARSPSLFAHWPVPACHGMRALVPPSIGDPGARRDVVGQRRPLSHGGRHGAAAARFSQACRPSPSSACASARRGRRKGPACGSSASTPRTGSAVWAARRFPPAAPPSRQGAPKARMAGAFTTGACATSPGPLCRDRGCLTVPRLDDVLAARPRFARAFPHGAVLPVHAQDARGAILRADIHHAPWPLQRAERRDRRRTPSATRRAFCSAARRQLLHFSRRLDVVVWPIDAFDR